MFIYLNGIFQIPVHCFSNDEVSNIAFSNWAITADIASFCLDCDLAEVLKDGYKCLAIWK